MKLSHWLFVLICGVLGAASGCASTPGSSSPDSDDGVFIPGTGLQYRAVCVGLTAVDPAAYGGWAGDCPGADLDADDLADYFQAGGIPTIVLHNKAATMAGVQDTIRFAAGSLKRDDVLIVTTSGHGGQVADRNGDEDDGLDETLCLWDGQWVDDDILRFLGTLPDGIRIFLISDNCHSEGNFRAYARSAQRAVSLGRWGRLPVLRLERREVGDLKIVQLAGCREASYSYGSATGGTWTQTLLANQAGTWREWFDAAAAMMPAAQTPAWAEFGEVGACRYLSVWPQ